MRYFAFFAMLNICCCAVSAQSVISFGVYDRDDKEPVAGALATLLCTADSTLREAVLADGNGRVALPADSAQWRSIVVSSLGYEKEIVKASQAQDSIYLSKKSNQLGELVVKQQMLTSAPGKFIFNPGELRDRKSSVLEMAQLTPLVDFSNGQPSVFGRGQAAIRINGRDLKMSTEDMTAYLNALPAGRVKTIEVIVQPGSDEASDGANAIVNIILDDPSEGLQGSASLTGRRDGRTYSGDGSVWFGYCKGKFSLSGSVSPYYRKGTRKQMAWYHYVEPDSRTVEETGKKNSNAFSLSGSITAQYKVNERSNAGLSFNLGGGRSHSVNNVLSVESILDHNPVTTCMSIVNNSPMKLKAVGGIGYYTLQTDSRGSKFDVSVDYAHRRYMEDYAYLTGANDIMQHTNYTRKGISVKPSYLWMLKGNHMLKMGYDYFHGATETRDSYNVLTNDFSYVENTSSVYAMWMGQLSSTFSLSAGLRLENNSAKGTSESGEVSFNRNTTFLIPSLSLDVNLPWYSNSVSVNFSRRLSHPFYEKLNPAMVQTSPTTYSIGNPYLKNEVIWNGSVYYTLLQSLIANVSVSYRPNASFDYTYDRDGMTVTGTENMGSYLWFITGLAYSRSIGNLYFKTSLDLLYTDINAHFENVDLSEKEWTFEYTLDAEYTVSRKHNIDVNAYYFVSPGRKLPGRYSDTRNILSLGASKRWASGWRASVDIYNILNYRGRQYFNSPSYSYSIKSLYDALSVTLSVRYNFGKQSVRSPRGQDYNELDLH